MSQFSVFQQQTKRESGKKAQHGNIAAAKVRSTREERSAAASSCVHVNTPIMLQAVADIIRSTLGPRSMLKMLLDPNGGMTTRYCCAHRKAALTPSPPAFFHRCSQHDTHVMQVLCSQMMAMQYYEKSTYLIQRQRCVHQHSRCQLSPVQLTIAVEHAVNH